MSQVVLALAMLQDPVVPTYEDWAAFKAGSTVTVEIFQGEEEKPGATLTYTLLSLTDTEIEVEVKGKQQGKDLKPRRFKVKKGAGGVPLSGPRLNEKKTEGEEEIEVSKKKYRCRWVEETWTEKHLSHVGEGTTEVREKRWISVDVPGRVVRWERERGGLKTRRVVAEWEAKK